MKSLQLQEAIRKAKFKQGKSNRQIAVELGISRNTVKKVVSQKQVTIPEAGQIVYPGNPKSTPVLVQKHPTHQPAIIPA